MVREGAELLCPGRDGRRTQSILDAMYRSAYDAGGDRVDVEPEIAQQNLFQGVFRCNSGAVLVQFWKLGTSLKPGYDGCPACFTIFCSDHAIEP